MKLNMVHKESYNCLQDFVASAAGYYECRYAMMQLELWGFKYQNEGKNIGEKLGLVWNGKLEERKRILKKFHGLELNYVEGKNIRELQKIVEHFPTAFYIDSYECEWLPFYQKQHRRHICNIVNLEGKMFVLQDETCQKDQVIRMPSAEILQKAGEFIIVKKNKDKEINVNSHMLKEEMDIACQRYKKNKMGEQLFCFALDLKSNFNLWEELPQGMDPVASKLLMYLKCLGDDRCNLIEVFEYYSMYGREDLMNINSCLLKLSQNYYMLRNYVLKYFFLDRQPDKEVISRKVDEIIGLEIELYQYVSELTGNGSQSGIF